MRHYRNNRCFIENRALCLALSLCLAGSAFAQGMLPSLDRPDEPEKKGITPISELTGPTSTEKTVSAPLPGPAPSEAAAEDKASLMLDADQQPALRQAHPLPEASPSVEAIPAVQTKPRISLHDLNPFKSEQKLTPVSYSPLPGIAIFPVLKHGKEKAFGDLPLIFAREYAQRMELKAPETKVYHPIYTVDELRIQGLGHVYDQIMSYYIKAGRPEPMAMDYLLKQLSTNGRSISRVIFVEADLDTSHPVTSTGLLDRVHSLMTDSTPKQMRYFVHSRLQVFDAERPEFPMVWAGSWNRSIKTNQFLNVTPSVFADSDSHQAFAKISRDMSRELLYVTPKEAYMAPQYDTSVQGSLVSDKEPAFPNLTEASSAKKNRITTENKQAIQRILQRQNAISP